MKAMAIEAFGSPAVFKLVETPRPSVQPGHLLVRVKATSVNPVDFKIRSGAASGIAPQLPAILHGDVAGIVEEVGAGIQNFRKGDAVYGIAGGVTGTSGALAELMLVDARLMALKPASLRFEESAALPLVSITAWEALVHRARLKAGQRVLIHGATGGVGHVAIQIAKEFGAKVFATVSSEEKAKIAKNLGADVTINYSQESVQEYVERYSEGKGFDIVFDTVGEENLDKSFEAAAINGTVVSISTFSTHDLSLLHIKGLSLHVVFMLIPLLHNTERERHGNILREIATLADKGHIKPLIHGEQFSFEQVGKAHALLESGKALGKVALRSDWNVGSGN